MRRLHLLSALALAAATAACAPTMGPPPPGRHPPPPVTRPGPNVQFSAQDFAWSRRPGANVIAGRVTYRQGPVRYSCSGASVVLTPETPWSRARMSFLYGPGERAALPSEDVRARTPRAPAGDAGPYVRRTTCDDADQFAFGGLPDGAWYVITVVRPLTAGGGDNVALMRRIVVRGGRAVDIVM